MARPTTRGVLLATIALAGLRAPAAAGVFEDQAPASGLRFTHFNGMSGALYFPEMTGQGAALLDYDGDGDLDVYLVQGAPLGEGVTTADAILPLVGEPPPRDRLFRQDRLADGIRFVDVTDRSRLLATGYGMGVAVADVDADGLPDLYLTNYGANQLWLSETDGSFSDGSAEAAVGDDRWSTSACFLDYDGDGELDLYVADYVQHTTAGEVTCYAQSSRRDYCGPDAYPPVPDRLYRGLGGGRFEDVSAVTGVAQRAEPGLGVLAADLDGDGAEEILVTNDGRPNFLWSRAAGGRLEEDGLFAGVAVNREGSSEASMGVAVEDVDRDGDLDLFMTHLATETDTLYLNQGMGLFEDRTAESGLATGSLPFTSFGTAWLDYNGDGWLDLAIASGAVRILEDQARQGAPLPLAQRNRLLRGSGGERFEEVPAEEAGDGFRELEVSRGLAAGDVDGDGDADLLLANNSGPARLLINGVGAEAGWIGVRVLARPPAGDAVGAVVQITGGGVRQLRRVHTDGSYASAQDPRVLVGLGGVPSPESVEIRRPRGAVRLLAPPVDRYLTFWADRAPEASR